MIVAYILVHYFLLLNSNFYCWKMQNPFFLFGRPDCRSPAEARGVFRLVRWPPLYSAACRSNSTVSPSFGSPYFSAQCIDLWPNSPTSFWPSAARSASPSACGRWRAGPARHPLPFVMPEPDTSPSSSLGCPWVLPRLVRTPSVAPGLYKAPPLPVPCFPPNPSHLALYLYYVWTILVYAFLG
jgi:hypothetical protein